MADTAINTNVYTYEDTASNRGGPYWTNTDTAYIIYVDANQDLVYDKYTTAGGWAGPTVLLAGTIYESSSHADWETNGDTGTKIHCVALDGDNDNVYYAYLDTSDDSHGTDIIEACQGTGNFYNSASKNYGSSIISKTRSGRIVVTGIYRDSNSINHSYFYTSADGDTWVSGSSPFEDDILDRCRVFHGNEADTNDIIATFWDNSASEITLKTYDYDGDSWSENGAAIATSMTNPTLYVHMDGVMRHSDNALLLAAWTAYDTGDDDLNTYEITGTVGSYTITTKAKVVEGYTESFLVSMFINQSNNYVYVSYAKGGTVGSSVTVYYQYSDDGMATWEGETAMQADSADDERWISSGAVAAANGGKFSPVWFNDDLNDLFWNQNNWVAIAASGGGWTNIAKINGVTATDLAKIDGISVDNIAKICGVAV